MRALLTINIVIYVLWVLFLAHVAATRNFVFEHLALNPALPGVLFEPWQFVTYNFLHLGAGIGGLIHIGFNLLWLYWIGREHEDLHGPHVLVAIYLITGVGGGLVTVLLHALFPEAPFFGGVIHGASASVLGVMTAVAVTYPYKKIGLFLLGTFRLIYLVLAFLVIDLLFLSAGGTAVGAHLGGVLFGFLFAKAEQKGIDLSSWARFFFGEKASARRQRGGRRGGERRGGEQESFLGRLEAYLASRSKRKEEGGPPQKKAPKPKRRTLQPTAPAEAPVESEIDRILDKISEQGMESLTEEERRVLKEASRR